MILDAASENVGRRATPLFARRRLLLAVLICLSGLAGACSSTPDLAAERHAKAVKALLDLGAEVRDVDDEFAHERGTFVILFPEHIRHDGHIDGKVLELLRDIQACFLGLSNTPIQDEGLADLNTMLELRLVNLFNTRITDRGLALLSKSPYVRLLKLNRTRISDEGLASLANMSSLRMLYLGETQITDDGLKRLADLPKLEALKLSHLPVSDDGLESLSSLPHLRYLGLDDTPVTAQGLKHLEALPVLVYLDVQHTAVSESEIESFQKRHPKCHVVR